MIRSFPLFILTAIGLSTALDAQQKEAPLPVQVRAVLHDPIHPSAELYYPDKAGVPVKLELRPQDLTQGLLMLPVNGSLVLYDKAEIDPKNPAASLAASALLPKDLTQAIVIILPAPEGTKPAYQMLVIENSEKAFPPGESRVLGLIAVEAAVQAGEHRLLIHPGKITSVPPVRKVNDYNMAQTNFYYHQGESWVPFTERQLQYLDACRRIFIVYTTPGALQPSVTTIVDTAPLAPPK